MEWKRLGDIANITIGEFVHRDKQNPKAKYPVYNGGTTYTGFYDHYNNTGNKIVISARGYAGFVNRVFDNYWAGNSSYSIDVIDTNIIWHFVYYYLKNEQYNIMSMQQKGGGLAAISKKQVQELLIPIPSLSEQSRIVSILDTFTDSIDNLKQQIEQRRKQYEHYRDQLLDLEGKEGVEMKIEDFCLLKAGKSIKADVLSAEYDGSNYPCFGGNGIRGYLPFYSHDGSYPIIGRQGALCGCINWATGKFYATEHAVVATGKNNVSQRFLLHLFQHADLNQYKTQGAQPGLSVAKLNEIIFVIPPLSEQSRIVSILDTFETSIANLEEQLKLREKQYEYYRNKLLTFE